jgi:hypothetical protein
MKRTRASVGNTIDESFETTCMAANKRVKRDNVSCKNDKSNELSSVISRSELNDDEEVKIMMI